jgi:hypothetical protein
VLRRFIVVLITCCLGLFPQLARAGDVNRASCPNELMEGFRDFLPDCRAYEQVTPPFKGGFPASIADISESGSRLSIVSFGAFSHPEDISEFGANYLADRSYPGGWILEPFDAAYSMFPGFRVEAVSPDLVNSLWYAQPSSQSVIPNVYLGVSPQGPFTEVGPSGPASFGETALMLKGVSQDLSHSLYEVLAPNLGNRIPLWPGDETAPLDQPSLYEYAGTNNAAPRLVGVSNAGSAVSLISQCGTYLGGLVGHRPNAYNAVSKSGDTVFFTALGRDYGICGSEEASSIVEPPVNELYARLNGSLASAQTVKISEPSKADCSECDLANMADAEFQGASFDGSKVFFTTVQHLLPGVTGAGMALYEYDFDGPAGGRVTLVSASVDPIGAEVRRVLRVTDDGSHVYFVARGVLTTTANAFGKAAEEGAENLYLYERDTAYPNGHVNFIGAGSIGTAQVTRDGRFLVFTSTADLTADEGESIEAGQVFEYDARTGALVRVSRGEAGYNEDGNSSIYAADIPEQGSDRSMPISKFTNLAVSADGAYVFFSSKDSLTPRAVTGLNNIYEYHEGHVALISDGVDFTNVNGESAVSLIGTTLTGEDVYFQTADPLVRQDGDTQLDTYDARIYGGFPVVSKDPSCSEDACQGSFSEGLRSSAGLTLSSGGEGPLPTVAGTPKSKKHHISKSPKKKRRKKHSRKVKKATGDAKR